MNPLWYDRQGNPISDEEANELLANYEARRVGLTEIGPYEVSTVFLVLDHNFGEGPPVLFETMVFPRADVSEDFCALEIDARRYCTEAEAVQGHQEMVTLIRATTMDPGDVLPDQIEEKKHE